MAGTYQPNAFTHLLDCLPCPVGSYQSSTGASACLACAGWTSTISTGATASSSCINSDIASLGRGGMYNLAQNQIAYYPFRSTNPLEDVSGNLGPLSASPTAPTISTGPWSASSAAQFTQSGSTCQSASGASSGQYYTLPSLSFPSTTLTVCLWYFPSNKFTLGRTRLFEFSTAPSQRASCIYSLKSVPMFVGPRVQDSAKPESSLHLLAGISPDVRRATGPGQRQAPNRYQSGKVAA